MEPIFDPDMIGSIVVPQQAKERCDQGIVKYANIEQLNLETGDTIFTDDIKPGDYVLFSGYTGTLVDLEDEGLMIILPVDFVVAKIYPPTTDIPGLYFKSKDGEYFTATHEMITKLISDAYQNAKWRDEFKVRVPRPKTEDYDNLK